MDALDHAVATAVLGLDTLWGGDVMNPSGLGRFIADSWFSDEPLPAAYTGAEAVRLRAAGGASAKPEAAAALDAYLSAVDVRGAIALPAGRGGPGRGAPGPLPRRARLLLRGDARPGARSGGEGGARSLRTVHAGDPRAARIALGAGGQARAGPRAPRRGGLPVVGRAGAPRGRRRLARGADRPEGGDPGALGTVRRRARRARGAKRRAVTSPRSWRASRGRTSRS